MARKTTSTGKGSTSVRQAGHMGGKKVQHERDLRDTKRVRGKAYDKPGPAKGSAFGIAAITRALEGLDFPVNKRDVLKKARHQKVEYRKGQPVDLHRIISDLDTQEFPSMANIVRAVSGALKTEGLSK
ncbi:MAG: DUF2795 domain-containing protein [Deltaproteobacteria bacterium]|nr:DUF2795 domain-containing protein [Deltaproteobacteria bacterium]